MQLLRVRTQAAGMGQIHLAKLCLHFVERRGARPVLPKQHGGRQTSLQLLDHPDRLRFGETASPHLVCPVSLDRRYL